LADSYAAWYTAYARTKEPHTPVDTEAKNDAKKASRAAMGIHNRDLSPTPIPVPTAQPEADLTFPGIHLVELRKIRPVSGAAPDPRSDYGVRIYYGFSGPPNDQYKFRLAGEPKTGKDLPYSVFTKRKKERFDFDGESGNTVYFCLRYENPTGAAGPYGPILRAVVP
jgi:hypothetical protein